MSELEVKIVGDDGAGNANQRQVDVHPLFTATGNHNGMIVLTHRLIKTEPSTRFFLNPDFGVAMNQDVSFGVIGSIIHDGGSSSSALTGSADADTLNKLEDSGAPFGDGSTVVRVGMTVENTNDSTYARISAVDSTSILSLTTIASKGETPADIFPDGTDPYVVNAVWAGVATIGAWDFSTGGVITQASGNNNDQADIVSASADQKLASDFTSLTGNIDLISYTDSLHNITIQMTLDGALIGNAAIIDDFIDTGDFGLQKFSIPMAELGLTTELTNGIRIRVIRLGGSKPAFTLDDIRLEISGMPLVYDITVDNNEKFHITELVFAYADAVDSTLIVDESTNTLAPKATMPALSFNSILGVAALPVGFTIIRRKSGITLFTATIKTLGQHISAGAIPDVPWYDGTNTFLILRVLFTDPLILTGDTDDTLTITINDNMSGLLQFTASARGSIET